MTGHAYLRLPESPADGVWWSDSYDAIEDQFGTLMVVEQLRGVLEGVFSQFPPTPHFRHVIEVIRGGMRGGDIYESLHRARKDAKRSDRNFGVVIAELLHDISPLAAPPSFAQVRDALHAFQIGTRDSDNTYCEPPRISPEAFRDRLAAKLEEFDTTTLAYWIRTGERPTHDSRLEKTLDETPPAVAESVMSQLQHRRRLAGVAALIPTFDAAFDWPGRRQEPMALPQGGYADVTNRGGPEQLLPSQLALDNDDFVRRYAENELLFFRREEPHAAQTPERLIVLDQGVRTWGSVRLALTAAVLSRLKQHRRKPTPFLIASTGQSGPPVDSLAIAAPELARILEASDLTTSPAARCRELLGIPPTGPRDVLLLTHPRSLREPELARALQPVHHRDRIFSLSVDDSGAAELNEWRGAGIVKLRSFRVPFGEEKRPKPAATAPKARYTSWTGNIQEPTFPFHPGLMINVEQLVFDDEGERLLAVGRDGVQLVDLGTLSVETLPVPQGLLLNGTSVPTVFFTSNDIVICSNFSGVDTRSASTFGRLPFRRPEHSDTPVTSVAHWNLADRKISKFNFSRASRSPSIWRFDAENSLVRRISAGLEDLLRLNSGVISSEPAKRGHDSVPQEPHSSDHGSAYASLLQPNEDGRNGPWVKVGSGVVWSGGMATRWSPFIPKSDGLRIFDQWRPSGDHCIVGGTTLGIEADRGTETCLFIFNAAKGRVLAQLPWRRSAQKYHLSSDGRLLAIALAGGWIRIHHLDDSTRQVDVIPWAGLHSRLDVRWAGSRLNVEVGRFRHVFDLQSKFCHSRTIGEAATESSANFATSSPENRDWSVAFDRGQVVVIRRNKPQVRMHILVRREQVAIVSSDGTRWGTPALLGVPVTPDAEVALTRLIEGGR